MSSGFLTIRTGRQPWKYLQMYIISHNITRIEYASDLLLYTLSKIKLYLYMLQKNHVMFPFFSFYIFNFQWCPARSDMLNPLIAGLMKRSLNFQILPLRHPTGTSIASFVSSELDNMPCHKHWRPHYFLWPSAWSNVEKLHWNIGRFPKMNSACVHHAWLLFLRRTVTGTWAGYNFQLFRKLADTQ